MSVDGMSVEYSRERERERKDGEMLHDLHHGGDLDGVVKMFTSALGFDDVVKDVIIISERSKNKQFNWSHPYLQDRYYFNIGLQALLKTNRHELAKSILQDGVINRGVPFGADTINIFIRDAFRRGSPDEAIEFFDNYFGIESSGRRGGDGRRPLRSTMSLNMMIEGFRSSGMFDVARKYAGFFEKFDLHADSYTYSSLVRMSRTSTEIWSILDLAESSNQISVPFLRCCVETFGKVGCPEDALNVYTQYLAAPSNSETSEEESRKSGDALLAGLLSCEHGGASSFHGIDIDSGYVALALANMLDESEEEGALLSRKVPLNLPSIKWGTRGYNLLFTYVGSMDSINSNRFNVHHNGSSCSKNRLQPLLSEAQTSKLRFGVRERLRSRVLSDMESALGSLLEPCNNASSIRKSTYKKRDNSLLPNGRVCDALLRSFGDDIDLGRAIWKKNLLPLARRMESIHPGSFMEITEKCFVALMYGCGQSGRPDVGMEIAKAARKNRWSPEEIAKLATAYTQGCRSARYKQHVSAFSLKRIIDKNADEILKIELGLVGKEAKKGPRIRIQLE